MGQTQPPAHFHARHQDEEVIVEIEPGVVIGRMSAASLRRVLEWLDQRRSELLENWELARGRRPLKSIAPPSIEVSMLHIDEARYLDQYRLRLWFDNGVIKDVDLAGELHGEVFEPLRDRAVFRQVFVNAETGTIEWPNGADLAPEFLFDIGETVEHVA
jgi:hypothetical protein